jgi:hypothetical protein
MRKSLKFLCGCDSSINQTLIALFNFFTFTDSTVNVFLNIVEFVEGVFPWLFSATSATSAASAASGAG